MNRILVTAALCALWMPPALRAQQPPPFWLETGGALIGGALGFGAVALAHDPGNCELECQLREAGFALSMGWVGGAAGAWLAGRAFDTRPSALGALVGSLAGVMAAVGTAHLLSEEANVSTTALVVVPVASVHALLTAAGSRLHSRWRGSH
ncbi:MAG: hypothetical protein R3E10_10980 [Gemmatimonadota bacterium]